MQNLTENISVMMTLISFPLLRELGALYHTDFSCLTTMSKYRIFDVTFLYVTFLKITLGLIQGYHLVEQKVLDDVVGIHILQLHFLVVLS